MSDATHSFSLIIPTFREVESLPPLIERLEQLIHRHSLNMEVLIVDDDSNDGSKELIETLAKPWICFIVRKTDRGLGPAVVEGIKHATHNKLVVMDADLSHPPEVIPQMLEALDDGYEFVMGSRYVRGASTAENWGAFRWLNSKIATLLAVPLAPVKDPMSGFFAICKKTVERASYLNPIGYKIGLELLVKCHCQKIHEIPIHFTDRQHGKSKLSLKQQFQYLQHLRRLYIYKYAEQSHLVQFLVVGLSGVLANLAILTLLLKLGISSTLAVAAAIAGSMTSNFFFNRRFTFSYARHQSMWKQFVGFAGACSIGAFANFITTTSLMRSFPSCATFPQLAALGGIAVGTAFNYLINRYLVFSKKNPAK